MSRPAPDPATLVSGQEGWDAILRDLLAAIVTNPMPVAQYADFASLPAAGSYERCLAATIGDNKLWFSDGVDWKEVAYV